jgi:hypothetical protein
MKRTKPKVKSLDNYSKTELMAYTTELVNRASLAARLGYQYGGDRNVYEALGYPTSITYDDYAGRYARQDIARAVINRPVQYTWKGPLVISEAGDDKETQLEKDWGKLEKRLKLKSKFVRVDKLSSVGTYGVLLLGFSDTKNKDDWATPAKGTKRQLNYVKPLGEGNAKIASYVSNPADERFGLVETYDVTITNPGGDTTSSFIAHYSRVLHITRELLESEVEGVPVMEGVWNRLMDLEKIVGGSAEMFWRGARPGYQAVADKDHVIGATLEADLQDQIDEYENNLRRMIVNQGVEFKALQSQVSNPSNHVDVQIQMISAETGIPKRILTGSERGELASTQDESSWFGVIQTRREEHAEANIIRPFVDMCIEYGILPKPSTEEYHVQWLDLFAPSDKDKAEVGKIRADALKAYSADPMAQLIMPPEAFFELFLGFTEEQREKVMEMFKEAMLEEEKRIAEEEKLMKEEGLGEPVEEEEEDEPKPVEKKKPIRRKEPNT